jgi:hydroxypyruvate reductase
MALALEQVVGDRITGGVINVKYGYTSATKIIELNEAGHPLPDERGVDGSARMVQLAREAGPRDLVLCLISGGGSALMPLPVTGISLSDVQAVTEALLSCGATINEINAIRKHVSKIKGGNLAKWVHPAELVSLVLSDVVGNPLDVIASGPTVPDGTTFAQALEVIEKYELSTRIPASILDHIQRGSRGEVAENPKAGDQVFDRTETLVIGSNDIAASAAVLQARQLGYNAMLMSTYVEGEAREVARVFASIGREIASSGRPLAPPACVVAGGETTVTIRGDGLGGRNQELALAGAPAIDGLDNVLIVALATDGTDGPTDAAGAVADGTTVARAAEAGLSVTASLRDNDSYHFFERLGDLLLTGPTNTNVNDLTFIFVFE